MHCNDLLKYQFLCCNDTTSAHLRCRHKADESQEHSCVLASFTGSSCASLCRSKRISLQARSWWSSVIPKDPGIVCRTSVHTGKNSISSSCKSFSNASCQMFKISHGKAVSDTGLEMHTATTCICHEICWHYDLMHVSYCTWLDHEDPGQIAPF